MYNIQCSSVALPALLTSPCVTDKGSNCDPGNAICVKNIYIVEISIGNLKYQICTSRKFDKELIVFIKFVYLFFTNIQFSGAC